MVLILAFLSCQKELPVQSVNTANNQNDNHTNLLDYSGTPTTPRDRNQLMFSDQGAWFAYSFPVDSSYFGGFSGPFLMTQENGLWISPSLSRLEIIRNGKKIDWERTRIESQPSHLYQTFADDSLTLNQELLFISGHTALIRSVISNIAEKPIRLSWQYKGSSSFSPSLVLSASDNQLTIQSKKSPAIGKVILPKGAKLTLKDDSYSTKEQVIHLAPGAKLELVISQSFVFPETSWEKERSVIESTDFNAQLQLRKQEKSDQMKALLSEIKPAFQQDKYHELIGKCLLTLQNNWRIPAGELKHAGLFPSYHYEWFHGFWSWDSWKHAVALVRYDANLAKDQVRAMFDFQRNDGFVVDCVYRDTLIEPHNYRDTKPPLAAWSVAKIFLHDQDTTFVAEMYPKLKSYHRWWYKQRDHDQDGLCEYGSTDGSLIAAKWESGMDNAIRFDDSKMLFNQKGAYSMNQESVDLNAYLYAEKRYLAFLAAALIKKDDSIKFAQEADQLKKRIQSQFYDTSDGWFYDTSIDGTAFIKGAGSEGWIPLWAQAATIEQAQTVKKKMMDPEQFFTRVPFQTMSADHPKFDPMNGYWRGPNWFDQAYFGIRGLELYGYKEDARKATIQLINGARGLTSKGTPIRENYHPLTGEGRNAKNFSWSAAHLIQMLLIETDPYEPFELPPSETP